MWLTLISKTNTVQLLGRDGRINDLRGAILEGEPEIFGHEQHGTAMISQTWMTRDVRSNLLAW